MATWTTRVDERPEGAELSIADEPHTVGEELAGYVLLLEVPRLRSPSTVSIRRASNGTALAEVSSTPAAGQFRVVYGPRVRFTGAVEFAPADAGLAVLVSYEGTGSAVWARDVNRLQSEKVDRDGAIPFTGNVGFGRQASGWGIHQLGGGHRLEALATPAAPTVTPQGTTGTTTYTYYVVAEDRNGKRTPVSAVGTTTAGNAILSATSFNRISWAAVAGAARYRVLRGNTATLLGSTTATTLDDTGQATTAYTPPTRNETADMVVDGTLTAGTLTTTASIRTGNLFAWAASNDFISNEAGSVASFLTSTGAALGVRVGHLLVSNSYSDTANVPANGAWVRGLAVAAGGVRAGTGIELGVGGHNLTIRNAANPLYLQWDTANHLHVANNSLVGIGTTDLSYVATDHPAGATNNKLFVNGSIQLLGSNDAIVFGRGTSTVLKDEMLAFGWGGGWHMTDGTYLRVYNDKAVYTAGAVYASSFVDANDNAHFVDPAGTSRLNSVQANVVYANTPGSGNAGGVSLYATDLDSYSVAFRQTAYWGTHGYVTADWATYLSMNSTTGRGWVFRTNGVGNVASVNNGGHAHFNGGVRVQDWFRNSTAGTGLYNEATARHLYSESATYWRMSSDNGMKLYAGDNATLRGYLYHDTTGFGLLHSGGGWAVRTTPSAVELYGTTYADMVMANTVFANRASSNAAGGISLYGTDAHNYGMFFRGTVSGSAWGTHGQVTGDWATYFTMYGNGSTRGWVFRATDTGSNVASISAGGHAAFNGSISTGSDVRYTGGVSNDSGFGLYFDSSRSTHYAIFREGGAWNSPYPDLWISFHTGIKIGAQSAYGGVRFYNGSAADSVTELMSVGNGDANVRIAYDLQVGGLYQGRVKISDDLYDPADHMKISRDGIMFGGPNAGKASNSAQISAGRHAANELCIVGMAADTTPANRRIRMWAEGGVTVHGTVTADGFVTASSRSVKENVNPFVKDAVALLRRVAVVEYEYRDAPGRRVGFIAEDTPAELTGRDGKAMDLATNIGVLIAAVQGLAARMDAAGI